VPELIALAGRVAPQGGRPTLTVDTLTALDAAALAAWVRQALG
jgi:hypothetical protein